MLRPILFIITILWSCISFAAPALHYKPPSEYPEAKARIGQAFELREMDEGLIKYAYKLSEKPKFSLDNLSYEKFHGKRGKVIDIVSDGSGSVMTGYFWQIEIEGEKYYARWIPVVPDYLESSYFLGDLDLATKLTGKKIWVVKQKLITPEKEIQVRVGHLDEVEVIGIDTKSYGHGFDGASPFWFRIKTADGKEGLVPYDKRFFFIEDPIKQSWNPAIIEAIRSRNIKLGMTPEQVRLSWGNPERINRTVAANTVLEQWIYGRQYLYIENGKVRSFQDSR